MQPFFQLKGIQYIIYFVRIMTIAQNIIETFPPFCNLLTDYCFIGNDCSWPSGVSMSIKKGSFGQQFWVLANPVTIYELY